MRKVFYTGLSRSSPPPERDWPSDASGSEAETELENGRSNARKPPAKSLHRRTESMDQSAGLSAPPKRQRKAGSAVMRQRQTSRELRDATGQRPLQKACARSDLARVKSILLNGPDLQDRDYAGTTALHTAALKGDEAIVRVLLEAGAVPDVRSGPEELDTPLMDAAANGYLPIVELLLTAGADPRVTNARGRTARDFLDRGDADTPAIARAMQRREAELRRKDAAIVDSPSHPCAPDGLFPPGFAGVQRLPAPAFLDVTRGDLIVQSASHGELEIVGSALERGWRPSAAALVSAAKYGHTEVVGLLLAFGLSANAKSGGAFALPQAIERGHLATTRLLLDSGAQLKSEYEKLVADLPASSELRALVLGVEPAPKLDAKSEPEARRDATADQAKSKAPKPETSVQEPARPEIVKQETAKTESAKPESAPAKHTRLESVKSEPVKPNNAKLPAQPEKSPATVATSDSLSRSGPSSEREVSELAEADPTPARRRSQDAAGPVPPAEEGKPGNASRAAPGGARTPSPGTERRLSSVSPKSGGGSTAAAGSAVSASGASTDALKESARPKTPRALAPSPAPRPLAEDSVRPPEPKVRFGSAFTEKTQGPVGGVSKIDLRSIKPKKRSKSVAKGSDPLAGGASLAPRSASESGHAASDAAQSATQAAAERADSIPSVDRATSAPTLATAASALPAAGAANASELSSTQTPALQEGTESEATPANGSAEPTAPASANGSASTAITNAPSSASQEAHDSVAETAKTAATDANTQPAAKAVAAASAPATSTVDTSTAPTSTADLNGADAAAEAAATATSAKGEPRSRPVSRPVSRPGSRQGSRQGSVPRETDASAVLWAERSQELNELAERKAKERRDREARMLASLAQEERRRSDSESRLQQSDSSSAHARNASGELAPSADAANGLETQAAGGGGSPKLGSASNFAAADHASAAATPAAADPTSQAGTAKDAQATTAGGEDARNAVLASPADAAPEALPATAATASSFAPRDSPGPVSPRDVGVQAASAATVAAAAAPAAASATASATARSEVSVKHMPWVLRRLAYTGDAQNVAPLLVHTIGAKQYYVDVQVALLRGEPQLHVKYPKLAKVLITARHKQLLWSFCRPWLCRPGSSYEEILEDQAKFQQLVLSWVPVEEIDALLFASAKPRSVAIRLELPQLQISSNANLPLRWQTRASVASRAW